MIGVSRRAAVLAAFAGTTLLVPWLSELPGAAASAPVAGELQARIDAAAPGTTLTLAPGIYAGPIVIGRPLTILGEPGTVIDGGGVGSVVTIAAPDVELAGLTVQGGGREVVGSPSGVLLLRSATRAYVHDVRVRHSYIGVTVQRTHDARLERLDILGSGIISGELHATGTTGEGAGDGGGDESHLRGDGIWLYDTRGVSVRDSRIDIVRDGIYLSYARDTVITGTSITNSRYAIHAMYANDAVIRDDVFAGNLSGVVLMYGGPILIEGDRISESGSPSTGFGVIVKDTGDVTIRRSVLADNRVGIHVDDAGRTGGEPTVVTGNTIAMNQIGVLLVPSADPTFTANAFIENTTQVALGGTGEAQARWTAQGIGNYWSDYSGFDLAGDGVGDLPYTRTGRTSQLVAENPLLLALASGPGLRLLSAVEDKWALGTPLVEDTAPRTRIETPPLDLRAPASAIPLWIPGAAMLLLCSWLIARVRRPEVRYA